MPRSRTNHFEEREIGERIRARRLALDMSQEHLAERIGVTFQQVQKYEKGVNRVAATRLMQIASVLNTDVTVLLGLDSKTSKKREQLPIEKFLSSNEGVTLCRAAMTLTPANLRVVIGLARSLDKELSSQ